MKLEKDQIEFIGDALLLAEETCHPIAPITTKFPELTEAESYAIQFYVQQQVPRKKKTELLGYKVGLTSKEAQKHFQLFHPDFGHLWDYMEVPSGGELPVDQLIQPKIEGEIAFQLGRDLKGPGVTASQTMAAVDAVFPSMEIVDSRIQDWKIQAGDTIADNGSSARYVLGNRRSPAQLDFETIGMGLWRNGELVITGSGAAVMGNPLHAVTYLANLLGENGVGLQAGQVILSGSIGGMIPMKKGESYQCAFRSLGELSVRAV